MFYIARCATGATRRSFTLRGALRKMRRFGADASVFSLITRRLLAQRSFTEATPDVPSPRASVLIAYPASVIDALHDALVGVDRDIEQQGAVSYETVDQVRTALALARGLND